MKQKKVSSFIKLISKINQINKQSPKNTLKHHEINNKFRKMPQERRCSNSINFTEAKEHEKQEAFQISGTKNSHQNKPIGIYLTEQSIKNRYDDKKNLYDIYRDSLSKKKTNQQMLNNPHRLRRLQDEFQYAHELAFPINRGYKLNQRKQSYTYKKIVRKKSFSLSNRSISILPESERKENTRKLKTDQNFDESSIKEEIGEQGMRGRKLNYKPIFRIKRLTLQNSKTQISHILPASKADKFYQSKKTIKLNTEPVQNDSKRVSFREKIKSKKDKPKMLQNEKFSGWQHERLQQGQQLCRMLM